VSVVNVSSDPDVMDEWRALGKDKQEAYKIEQEVWRSNRKVTAKKVGRLAAQDAASVVNGVVEQVRQLWPIMYAYTD
jgi:hypothetical protein